MTVDELVEELKGCPPDSMVAFRVRGNLGFGASIDECMFSGGRCFIEREIDMEAELEGMEGCVIELAL